jgi:hypothetical protein
LRRARRARKEDILLGSEVGDGNLNFEMSEDTRRRGMGWWLWGSQKLTVLIDGSKSRLGNSRLFRGQPRLFRHVRSESCAPVRKFRY